MMTWLAALLVAGCSQNEVTEVSPDAHPQVGFSVYTGVPTRGVDMTTTSMQDDPGTAGKYGGFGIMGYYTGQSTFDQVKTTVTPSFMHNQMVKWDATGGATGTGAWTYSPVKYWPNRENDRISFFAYAPYETAWATGTKAGVVVSAATEKGIPYIDFTLKGESKLKEMVDLVVADQRDMTYTPANKGEITFQFEHTLSRVSFKAQLGDADFPDDGSQGFVYITRMWIVGTDHAASGSNLSLIGGSTTNTGSKFYTKAKWSELHWKYDDAVIPTADFSLNNILDLENDGITESNNAEGHSGIIKGIRITNKSKASPVSLFPDKQYLYLIPVADNDANENLSSGCAEGDIQFGFHYDIVTPDQTTPGQYVASHAEAIIKVPAGHMKRKKSYIYTLKINLNEITIKDAKVTDWDPVPADDVVIE